MKNSIKRADFYGLDCNFAFGLLKPNFATYSVMESFGKVLKSMKLADLRELRENAAFLVSRVPSDVCAGYFEETRYTYSVKKAPKTRGSPRISVEVS